MFSVRTHVPHVKDIPSEWIFENYLNLPEPLTGQRVKINSVFNLSDKTPSMVIYVGANNKYIFKDFSSGTSGDGVNLVSYLFKLDLRSSAQKISEDYELYLKNGKEHKKSTFKATTQHFNYTKWVVEDVVYRDFSVNDANFWMPYNITGHMLKRYDVRPIHSYNMREVDSKGNVVNEFHVRTSLLFGYHDHKGELYKIYQPKSKKKFIKIKDHIQGSDKIGKQPTLIIASSLKDCMSLKSLGLRIEAIAPDSESCILSKEQIDVLKKRFKKIVVILDSDETGVKSMVKYKELYDLPFIYLPLEKDISDIVKHHGKERALVEIVPKLNHITSS
jgi:hypothetical protein